MKTEQSQPSVEQFRFSRGNVRVRRLNDPRDDGRDWLRETPQRRIEAVAAAFHEFGFSQKEIDARIFLEPKSIVEVGREPLKLHVMNAISGVTFEEAYERRENVRLNGIDVPFIGFEDLVRNKAATGRGKDRVDAEELNRRRNAK